MSESVDCCIQCGKKDPDLHVECVRFSPMHNVVRTGGSVVSYGFVQDKTIVGHACSDCAKRAGKRSNKWAFVRFAIGGFGLGFLLPYLLWFVVNKELLQNEAAAQNAPYGLLLAVAVLAALISALVGYRKYAALPVEFGVAFLLEKKDPDHFCHLPCDRSVYPGKDEKAKKRLLYRLCPHPQNVPSSYYDDLWNKHIH